MAGNTASNATVFRFAMGVMNPINRVSGAKLGPKVCRDNRRLLDKLADMVRWVYTLKGATTGPCLCASLN